MTAPTNRSDSKLLFGLVLTVSACALICLASLGANQMLIQYSQSALGQTAGRLGVKPTLDGLGQYIVAAVKAGMSRAEVEGKLSAIGPLSVERGALEDVGLPEGPTACDLVSVGLSRLPWDVWKITACYDSRGALVNLDSTDAEYPVLAIYAKIRRPNTGSSGRGYAAR